MKVFELFENSNNVIKLLGSAKTFSQCVLIKFFTPVTNCK